MDDETECIDGIEIRCITRAEIRNAMHKMKKGKAAGIDSITVELYTYIHTYIHTYMLYLYTVKSSVYTLYRIIYKNTAIDYNY